MTIANEIIKLEKVFDALNEKYFNNELHRPVITIQSDTTKGAYGWCTNYKAWVDGEIENYEINICAEYLNRGVKALAETMLHEMVHLDNVNKGIQDTSNNGFYHNVKYKKAAEQHGLIVEKDNKYGWCRTELNAEAEAFVEGLGFEDTNIVRKKIEKAKKTSKNNSIKYVCPCCGAIVRATRPVMIGCMDCNEMMIAAM